jgi:replicative DNA helicase
MSEAPSLGQFQEMAYVEAERSIIGALLCNPALFDAIDGKLRADHFLGEDHKATFATLATMATTGKAIDPITVADAMGEQGDMAYLGELAQRAVVSERTVVRHAELIVDRFRSLQLAKVVSRAWELSYEHSTPIDDRIQEVQASLSSLQQEAPRDEWLGIYQSMVEHTQVIEERATGKRETMTTGLSDLDEYLEGGLRAGELVIVGARPSMGKTALGLTIGVHIAAEHKVGVLSMEMSHSEVNDRLSAMLGSVSLSAVKRPTKGGGLAWDRVMEGVERAKALHFNVCDQGGLNINQVRAKARALKRSRGLDVLVVDYIGLMSGMDPKANRNTQLEEISRGLKGLAKELRICVLCLAQLNRKSEERPDQMPMMSDLRDSGAIEQDADVILFIKRPIMSNPELGDEWKFYAKLSVAKNRQGRCGVLDLSYIGEQTKFSGWSGPAPSKAVAGRAKGGGL